VEHLVRFSDDESPVPDSYRRLSARMVTQAAVFLTVGATALLTVTLVERL
jgi:hypothetical protein